MGRCVKGRVCKNSQEEGPHQEAGVEGAGGRLSGASHIV